MTHETVTQIGTDICIAKCSCGWERTFNTIVWRDDEIASVIKGHIPTFNLTAWIVKLNALTEEIVAQKDQEIAIDALYHYDQARKKMDRVQAVPPARR